MNKSPEKKSKEMSCSTKIVALSHARLDGTVWLVARHWKQGKGNARQIQHYFAELGYAAAPAIAAALLQGETVGLLLLERKYKLDYFTHWTP